MNAVTLQALRRLLFLSVEEAARIIGDCSPRAWQHWERGLRAVPVDVERAMLDLIAWRNRAINTSTGAIADAGDKLRGGPERIALIWYVSLDDWITLPDREPQHWRPHCSVVAQVAGLHPEIVDLVPFDAPAYSSWLGQRADGELMRARWAAQISDPE